MRTPDRLSATYHAALRYLERVDPREPHPRQQIRELVDRARRADRVDVDGTALVDDETGTVLVADIEAGEVVTLWPEAQR